MTPKIKSTHKENLPTPLTPFFLPTTLPHTLLHDINSLSTFSTLQTNSPQQPICLLHTMPKQHLGKGQTLSPALKSFNYGNLYFHQELASTLITAFSRNRHQISLTPQSYHFCATAFRIRL